MDKSLFDSKLVEGKLSKEQQLFERVLAAALAADRQGLLLEVKVLLDQDAGLKKSDVELVWGSSKFRRALADRGIRSTADPNLSLRQEMFLQAYLNPLNLLTPQVLAKRMKISLSELDGWLRQKDFAEAMKVKAEENLQKFIPMADVALGQLVQSGDMKAIQFVNQLTGRFDPNARSSVDVPALLLQVQDIILRHVTDASVKRNIARELIAMASGVSHLGVVSEPVSGMMEIEADVISEEKL